MSRTVLPTMIVEDVELRMQPPLLMTLVDPIGCDHLWEAHLLEVGRAYCTRCGSLAHWVNDPRAGEVDAS